MGALSLTASKSIQKKNYNPLVPGITHVPYAYCYRCAYGVTYPDCGIECVRWIEENLFRTVMPAEEVAAVFVEPIQGEGGYIVPPPEFHRELARVAGKYGILFVADEVQSGMGRTGLMCAIEHFGVTPDIIALAKGIASGLPLGAMVARAEIMDWEAGSHALHLRRESRLLRSVPRHHRPPRRGAHGKRGPARAEAYGRAQNP